MSTQSAMDAEALKYLATMPDEEFNILRQRLKSLAQIYMEMAMDVQNATSSSSRGLG